VYCNGFWVLFSICLVLGSTMGKANGGRVMDKAMDAKCLQVHVGMITPGGENRKLRKRTRRTRIGRTSSKA